jgi:transposase
MAAWVRAASDKATYQRRLAISLIARERHHVPDVARTLDVSEATVWRWLQQFNRDGPAAVVAQPRGGRRTAHLTPQQEAALLRRFRARALRGRVLTADDLRPAVEDTLGQPVSRAYLYDLLRRHDWRKVVPRPRHVDADPAAQEAYKKSSRAASGPR